jgi:hypothetical protein
MKLILTF